MVALTPLSPMAATSSLPSWLSRGESLDLWTEVYQGVRALVPPPVTIGPFFNLS
jgi:hypothetical protein